MKLYPFVLHTLSYALPAIVGITLIGAVAYVNDQQSWRMMANEPQEWLAQNAANAAALPPASNTTDTNRANTNATPSVNIPVLSPTPEDVAPIATPTNTTSVSGQHIAIERDEVPYTVLYDSKRNAVSGTGYLHGVLPQLPDGIFDAVDKAGVNRLTWQPEPSVRQAIVVLPIKGGSLNGGYALAGRSLAYTEWQESQLMHRWAIGWLVSVIGILLISCILTLLHSRRRTPIESLAS